MSLWKDSVAMLAVFGGTYLGIGLVFSGMITQDFGQILGGLGFVIGVPYVTGEVLSE